MAKTYEMVWDCEYCGSKKLLGKTHRFCPGCGAPQNPERRYYPPEDEKVAVEDHEYVGADRVCPACDSAMNAKAVHCTQCGSPMEGAGDVARVTDGPAAAPEPSPQLAGRDQKSGFGKWVLLGCLAVIIGGVLTAVFWRKQTHATVVGHSWERVIHVETFGPASESAWCDEMPKGAYSVSRSRDVRSHREVEDGQDCKTVRIDNGDGTYREEEKCTPRYRNEPVYDDRCEFTVDRWTRARSEKASGASLASSVQWPQLSMRTGTCRGCEREGGREERYRVQFTLGDGGTFDCGFDQAKWRAMGEGSRWRVKLSVLTGAAACGSLEPAVVESTDR